MLSPVRVQLPARVTVLVLLVVPVNVVARTSSTATLLGVSTPTERLTMNTVAVVAGSWSAARAPTAVGASTDRSVDPARNSVACNVIEVWATASVQLATSTSAVSSCATGADGGGGAGSPPPAWDISYRVLVRASLSVDVPIDGATGTTSSKNQK